MAGSEGRRGQALCPEERVTWAGLGWLSVVPGGPPGELAGRELADLLFSGLGSPSAGASVGLQAARGLVSSPWPPDGALGAGGSCGQGPWPWSSGEW